MVERLSPESLVLHIYPNCIKFGNGDESFVHGGAMMLFLKALEKGGLPAEFIGLFDSVVKYKNGFVNVQIYDHRGNSTTHTATTLHTTTSENNNESKVDVVQLDLRDDPGLIWNEIWKMAGGLSAKSLEDGMLELESKILLATAPPLCLDPSIEVTKFNNVIQYNERKFNFRRKRRRNVYELEEEKEEKNEEDQLLFMMDEKRENRQSAFQPSFARLDFIQNWRKRKQTEDSETSAILEPNKRQNGDRVVIRSARFKREVNGQPIYTLLNVYVAKNQEYDAELRWGTVPDTSINGRTFRFRLGGKGLAGMFVSNFLKLYTIDNKQIFDTINTAQQSQQPNRPGTQVTSYSQNSSRQPTPTPAPQNSNQSPPSLPRSLPNQATAISPPNKPSPSVSHLQLQQSNPQQSQIIQQSPQLSTISAASPRPTALRPQMTTPQLAAAQLAMNQNPGQQNQQANIQVANPAQMLLRPGANVRPGAVAAQGATSATTAITVMQQLQQRNPTLFEQLHTRTGGNFMQMLHLYRVMLEAYQAKQNQQNQAGIRPQQAQAQQLQQQNQQNLAINASQVQMQQHPQTVAQQTNPTGANVVRPPLINAAMIQNLQAQGVPIAQIQLLIAQAQAQQAQAQAQAQAQTQNQAAQQQQQQQQQQVQLQVQNQTQPQTININGVNIPINNLGLINMNAATAAAAAGGVNPNVNTNLVNTGNPTLNLTQLQQLQLQQMLRNNSGVGRPM